MKKILILLPLLVIFMLCATAAAESSSVVCTCFPCYDFARAVLGNDADLTMLIRPGTEVHSYEPTPSDIITITNCDMFIYIGGESDVWVNELLDSLGDDAPQTLKLFDCVEGLTEEVAEGMTVHENPEEDNEYDEHIWTSPVNACAMVNAVKAALTDVCPQQAECYSANAAAYIAELRDLDSQFRMIADTSARDLIVVADRFPLLYFVREYGIGYKAAFPSCTSESEPSAKTVAYLIDTVREQDIPAVLVLEMSSGRIAKTIAEETGAEIRTFYSLQSISAEDFRNGETYVSLMRRNVQTLKEALN